MAKTQKPHITIEAANPTTDVPACLGKVRYESEEVAHEESSFRPYYCVWCDGWHTSARGFRGARKGM